VGRAQLFIIIIGSLIVFICGRQSIQFFVQLCVAIAMYRVTAKSITFFTVGFVLGLVFSTLVNSYKKSVLIKECTDHDTNQFYQLYKSCINRLHEKYEAGGRRGEGSETNFSLSLFNVTKLSFPCRKVKKRINIVMQNTLLYETSCCQRN